MKKPNAITFGVRLKSLRRAKGDGWTQQKVADLLGVTVQTVQHHEQGRRILTVTRLMEYCRVLGVPWDAFKDCV